MNCKHCNKSFPPNRNGMKRFCSGKCKYLYKRANNICVSCLKSSRPDKAQCSGCAALGGERHKRYRKRPEVIEQYEYYNQTVLQKRSNLLDSFKIGKPCADCGLIYPPYVMDFDHIDPTGKTELVSQLVRMNSSKMIEEMKKCELVCANCHRIRTHRQGY